MQSLTDLQQKYPLTTDGFDKALADYYSFCHSIDNPTFDIARANTSFHALCLKFDTLVRTAANEAKVSESADIYYAALKDVIPEVVFSTHSTKMEISFKKFRDFILLTRLENAQNIKYMKDDFWTILLELSTLGKFEFHELNKPGSESRKDAPQLFNKTSNFFKLFRNYFMDEIYYGRVTNLGVISVHWPPGMPFEELIPKTVACFKLMYQLNFMLWRYNNKKVKL